MPRPIPVLTLCVAAALARPVAADDSLRNALAQIAGEIASKFQPDTGVKLGGFAGPAKSGGGPGLAVLFKQELERLGLRFRADGPELRGEFAPAGNGPGVTIAVSVVGSDGRKRETIRRSVQDERALAALFGPTFVASGDGPAVGPQFFQQLLTPTAVANDARIWAAKTAECSVEVLVGPLNGTDAEYQPRKPSVEKGQASVNLRRGEAFALRLRNDSAKEMWAAVALDGLNLYAFSSVKDDDGRPKHSRVVIDPKSNVLIRGWHRTHDQSQQFVVTAAAQGAAAELGAPLAGIGLIAVAFGPTQPKPEDALKRRGLDLGGGTKPRGVGVPADAIGRGPLVESQFVDAERDYAPARELVGIRYGR